MAYSKAAPRLPNSRLKFYPKTVGIENPKRKFNPRASKSSSKFDLWQLLAYYLQYLKFEESVPIREPQRTPCCRSKHVILEGSGLRLL
jgi:hypothetical protein